VGSLDERHGEPYPCGKGATDRLGRGSLFVRPRREMDAERSPKLAEPLLDRARHVLKVHPESDAVEAAREAGVVRAKRDLERLHDAWTVWLYERIVGVDGHQLMFATWTWREDVSRSKAERHARGLFKRLRPDVFVALEGDGVVKKFHVHTLTRCDPMMLALHLGWWNNTQGFVSASTPTHELAVVKYVTKEVATKGAPWWMNLGRY